MLRYFFEKAKRGAWSRGTCVLVAVPGSITPVEKRAVYNRPHRAGAAASLSGQRGDRGRRGGRLPITEPVASMICDIGGGTTEVAVLSLGDVVASTSVRVGGDRMDQAMRMTPRRGTTCASAWPRPSNCASTLAAPCRSTKSLDPRSAVSTPRPACRDDSTVERRIARGARGPLDEILDAIKTTLDGCSPDLAADLVDHGITVCGGAVLLRQFDVLLAERIGLPVAHFAGGPLDRRYWHADFARRPAPVAADAGIE